MNLIFERRDCIWQEKEPFLHWRTNTTLWITNL